MTLNLVYLGNFGPPHSTENDVLRTLRDMNVNAVPLQEDEIASWAGLVDDIMSQRGPDMVLWTRTKSLSARIPLRLRHDMLAAAQARKIPTVGLHLDRWWGLNRENDLHDDPFFHVQYLFTADGHDQRRWKAIGANHHWSPPAIAPHNAKLGQFRHHFASEIAFVGSWQSYGHTEWGHRTQLINFLRRHYGRRVRFWPQNGHPAVRGDDLADLYASANVLVGDSCLVPDGVLPWSRYCSDRVFETIGRGGFLIHPAVRGVTDGGLLTSGEHLATWELWDWDGLRYWIDRALEDADWRDRIALAGFDWVKQHHTYQNRLRSILRTVGVFRSGYPLMYGKAPSARPETPQQEEVRPAGEPEVPDSRQGPRSEREGESHPAVQGGSDLGVDQEPNSCAR